MTPSRKMHSILSITRMILLLAITLALAAVVDAAFPLTTITSPYRQTKSVHFMNIDAGASPLTGSLAMQPGTFGTHFPITSTVAGLPSFSGELVLPNSADDFLLACRDPTLRNYDDFNQTFTGKVMVIRRGTCAFGLKGKKAELAGAAALIVYGCPTAAPTLCEAGLKQPLVAVTQVGIPVTFIQAADGEAIVAYLTARNAAIKAGSSSIPSPVIMQVASTGALVSTELAAVRAIAATTTMNQDTTTTSFGNLRPWNPTNLNNAALDPCLDRIAGIWCENGHIVEIYLAAMKWTSTLPDGSIPPEFGTLTQLRSLSIQSNMFRGAVPPSFCQLTKLQELYLQLQVTGNYDGLTSLPSCLNALVSLNSILVNNNQLVSFPDLNASPNLVLVDLSNNHIPSLPPSFATWTKLDTFSGSNNQISVLPALSSLTKITSFKMSGNLLTDVITATTFDNLPTLTTLDLSNNQLSGVLPSMTGCTQLTSLVLSSNKLNSAIPLVWPTTIPNLLVFKASHNQILSPVGALNSLVQLQTIDLSWNALTAYTGDPTQTGDAGAMISGMTGPSVITNNVAHNNISGYFGNSWLSLAKQLKTLDISYNRITQLPTDIFTLTITSFDASNNLVTTWGATTTTPSTNFVYLSLINNPGLIAASLPTWMKADVQMVTNPGSLYQCPRIYNPDNIMMTIRVDAQFTQFQGCQCVPGRFGAPPLCYTVPQASTLAIDGSFSSSSIGTDFGAVVQANSNRTEPTANQTLVDRSFSDAWYGNQRLTLGISTAFVVDLRPSSPSSSPPIRFITLHIHINLALFDDSNDFLTIYQGADYLASTLVAAAQGTLPIPPSSSVGVEEGFTKTTEYQTLYGVKLASMGTNVALWEVVVLGPVAVVSFASRDTGGRHFFTTYSYSYSCEDLGIGYFYDEGQAQCRAPLEMYKVSSGIRAAVFALSALAIVFVAVVTVFVVMHFDTPVIRASSRPFLLLTLLFLGMMSLGSLLYAAIPDESSTGKAVCNGRVWLAAFPLTGILAVLLAKTNRISNIFTTTQLTSVRHVKDQELGAIVGGMLAVTSIMLIIYSGVPLNSPRVAEGTSTYANKLVSSCHNESGFGPWITILLIYIFVLMIAAAVLAFKARDVPSRFNESTHIMNALFLLIFFGALIVPLDIFIQDSPDASVLIQGIGQALLVMTLTGIIFLPKLYVLYTKGSSSSSTTETGGNTLPPLHTSSSTLPKVIGSAGIQSPKSSLGGTSGSGTGSSIGPVTTGTGSSVGGVGGGVDVNGRRKASIELSSVPTSPRVPSTPGATVSALSLPIFRNPNQRAASAGKTQQQQQQQQQQQPQTSSAGLPDLTTMNAEALQAMMKECEVMLAKIKKEPSAAPSLSHSSSQQNIGGSSSSVNTTVAGPSVITTTTANDDTTATDVPVTPNDITLQQENSSIASPSPQLDAPRYSPSPSPSPSSSNEMDG